MDGIERNNKWTKMMRLFFSVHFVIYHERIRQKVNANKKNNNKLASKTSQAVKTSLSSFLFLVRNTR